MPEPGAFATIAAVNVTDVPGGTEVCKALTVVVVVLGNCLRQCLDVLVVSFVLPPYTAVIQCLPTASAEVVNVALPELLSVPMPSTFCRRRWSPCRSACRYRGYWL